MVIKPNTIIHGDCLEWMKHIADNSADMILCDLPYGTVRCAWDTVIPFDKLWEQYKRIIKPGKAIVLTASPPFTYALANSNLENFKYAWVWDKKFGGNFVQAKRMPIKVCEDVLVFAYGGKHPDYYPQMIKRDKSIVNGGNGNPKTKAIPIAMTDKAIEFGNTKKVYDEKFPTTLLEFSGREGRGLHPTQKPVSLFEYLIQTYTLPGELVLDNTAGSLTTAVAASRAGRNFICIERTLAIFTRAYRGLQTFHLFRIIFLTGSLMTVDFIRIPW